MENKSIALAEKEAEDELDFSDIVKERYLPVIGEMIGKKLEKENCRREAREFGFPCDLYITVPGNEAVIIENQYGLSDHDHFGKLFTYSANLTKTNAQYPVTNIVWILIEGAGTAKFRKGHFEATEFINDYCEKNGIGFKIWCFVASWEGDRYSFAKVSSVDDEKYITHGNEPGEPLHPFMVKLSEAIAKNGFGEPTPAGNKGKCLALTPSGKDYWVNIPFRIRYKQLKVEVIFDKNNIPAYRENIREYFSDDFDEWLEENELFLQEISQYDIQVDFVGSDDHAKIYGYIPVKTIDREDMWGDCIEQLTDLLGKMIGLADHIAKKYCE